MKIYTNDPDSKDISGSIKRLQFLADVIPALLDKIPDAEFNSKPTPGKWSSKEILGHLIDSATNNHQRFIRIRFQDRPMINYDQDEWVSLSNYDTYEKDTLIKFWEIYNRHLIHLLSQIPPTDLQKTGIVRNIDEEKPLHFFINDYVAHLEHHLKQIVDFI